MQTELITLLLSFLIRGFGIVLVVYLFFRSRDWRILLLALVFVLGLYRHLRMAQGLDPLAAPGSDFFQVAMSAGILVALFFMWRLMEDRLARERQLIEREEFYQQILNGLQVLVWMTNADRKGVYFNSAWHLFTGQSKAEEGITWIDFIHPDDQKRCLEAYQVAFQSQESASAEFRLQRADGEYRWMWGTGAPWYSASGELGGFLCSCFDITQRKEAEARFQDLYDNAPDMHLSVEVPSARILHCNRTLKETLGYAQEELEMLTVIDLYHPDSRDRAREAFHRFLQSGLIRDEELQLQRKNGSRLDVSLNVTAIRDAQGEIRASRSVWRDITQAKKMEQALRESEGRFRSAFEDAPIGMAIQDLEGRYLRVNRALCEQLGYSEEELLSKSYRDITHPEDLPMDSDYDQALLSGDIRSHKEEEKRYLDRNGNIIWALVSCSMVQDIQKQPLYRVTQIQNITRRKQAEESLKDYSNQLRALSRELLTAQEAERRHIAQELHDEIGQALTTVVLALQASQTLSSESPRQQCLEILNTTIDQIRSLSLDLRPSILDILGLEPALQWYLQRHTAPLSLDVSLESSIGNARYCSEMETACFRIVQEAITNVLRHAKATEATVKLEQDQDLLTVTIIDNGQGFEPQARAEEAIRGRSVGLLSMKERAQLLGGSIHFHSKPGEGTRVEATFPINGNKTEPSSKGEAQS